VPLDFPRHDTLHFRNRVTFENCVQEIRRLAHGRWGQADWRGEKAVLNLPVSCNQNYKRLFGRQRNKFEMFDRAFSFRSQNKASTLGQTGQH
jgi:hypothetical protein